MNVKRELLRAWIVGSLLWILGWIAFIWQSCITKDIPPALGGGHAVFCRTSLLDDWMGQPRYFGVWEYTQMLFTGMGIPIVCLLIGLGVLWVIRGFWLKS